VAEHAAQRGVGVGGLADDREAVLGVEQQPQARADDAMAVGQDDRDRAVRGGGRGARAPR
jgi:hypothetical protein